MKRILSLLLVSTILFSCMALCASAEVDRSKITGIGYDSYPFYYEDAYFDANASDYNPSLATMSASLAFSGIAGTRYGPENQSYALSVLLEKIGFTNYEVNEDYKKSPEMDTMGVAVSTKVITCGGIDYTLLAIVPRSDGYEAEWANNFTLGSSGEAYGFSSSAAKVEQFAEDYLLAHPTENTLKLWIVGYSRGAAVANLVAGHLTAAGVIGSHRIDKENIFGYTFNTPAGLSTDVCSVEEARQYTNIHNIISANDCVPKVGPSEWGFFRYGTDESLIPETRTNENSDLFDVMVSYLPDSQKTVDSSGKSIALIETYQGKKLSMKFSSLVHSGNWKLADGIYVWEFSDSSAISENLIVNSEKNLGETWDDLISSVATGVGDRRIYATALESTLRLILSTIDSKDYQLNLLRNARALLQQKLKEYEESILVAAFTGKVVYLEKILYRITTDVINESGLDVKAYLSLPGQISAVIPMLATAIIDNVAISGGADILTLIENFDILSCSHLKEYTMSWMIALDPSYNPSARSLNSRVVDVNIISKESSVISLFRKMFYQTKDISIAPVLLCGSVQKIEYRTSKLGVLKTGSSFRKLCDIQYLFIKITDSNGNVTKWEYQAGRVSPIIA